MSEDIIVFTAELEDPELLSCKRKEVIRKGYQNTENW